MHYILTRRFNHDGGQLNEAEKRGDNKGTMKKEQRKMKQTRKVEEEEEKQTQILLRVGS